MKPFTQYIKTFLFGFLLSGLLPGISFCQQLTINPRSSLVLNGNVTLVINNAAFANNGSFEAGNSTVVFSGHADTATASYISGSDKTTFNNLTVSKEAYGVALKSSVDVRNVLTVNDGNLYTDDHLTLKSDANLTARVAPVATGSNITGKVNVERYFPAKRSWRLLTAPVTGSGSIFNTWQNSGVYQPGVGMLVTGPAPTGNEGNGLDYSAQNNYSLKTFNPGSQKFEGVANTKRKLSDGSKGDADNDGYFAFVRGDRNPSNTTVGISNHTVLSSVGSLQTGTQIFDASPSSGKYTLIGNPYASPVSFDKIVRNNIIKRMYVWDPNLNLVGAYVMLDDLDNDGVYVQSVGGSGQTNDIQSSQAFFVQTYSNGPASLVFNESVKSENSINALFRPMGNATAGAAGEGKLSTTLLLLNADNSTVTADGVIAEFNNRYADAIDLNDALKFSNINESISIISKTVSLVADRRPALTVNDTICFKLASITQRAYRFSFEASDLEMPGILAFLEDSYLRTSTVINLSGITNVNFSVNGDAASAAADRFRIVFKQIAGVLPVTISNVRAYKTGAGNMVEWTAASEMNLVKYDVEKSTDGAIFIYAGTNSVKDLNNSSNTYTWLDVAATQGNNFYRIKSYDKDGSVKYSAVVSVTAIAAGTGSFTVFPNPVTGNTIHLSIVNRPVANYQVKLINLSGQVMLTKNVQTTGGNSTVSLKCESVLVSGIYQLEIKGDNDVHVTQKVIVL